jgi:hypothetical protein
MAVNMKSDSAQSKFHQIKKIMKLHRLSEGYVMEKDRPKTKKIMHFISITPETSS